MKKSFLFFVATALMISCSNDSIRNEVAEDEIPIGFVPTFMEKVTRANAGEMIIQTTPTAVNTFDVNGNTFEVWGWKTNSESENTKIFDNQVVTYNSANLTSTPTTGWGYTPVKYWDRKSSYMFYATAPDGVFSLDEDDDTPADRIFSATSVPSVQILADMNGTSKVTSSTTTAIDYLVAAVVNCAVGANNQGNATDKDVAFTFSHILTKLTVKVLTTTDFNNTGNNKPQIKLTNLKIKLNGMAQNYTQKTAGSVQAGATDKDAWSNAITTAIEKVCFNADDTEVSDLLLSTTKQEVASYFVAPTTTGTTGNNAVSAGSATVTVTAKYDVYYSDGVVDHCETPETTVENLTSFVQNTHNILNVTVSPQAILFDVETVNGFTPETEYNQDVH